MHPQYAFTCGDENASRITVERIHMWRRERVQDKLLGSETDPRSKASAVAPLKMHKDVHDQPFPAAQNDGLGRAHRQPPK